jgi:hypothetical protein
MPWTIPLLMNLRTESGSLILYTLDQCQVSSALRRAGGELLEVPLLDGLVGRGQLVNRHGREQREVVRGGVGHSGSRVRITGGPPTLSAKKVVHPLPFQKLSYLVENHSKSAKKLQNRENCLK